MQNLDEKIAHARGLSESYEAFSFSFLDLLKKYSKDEKEFLIYLDQEGSRQVLTYSGFSNHVFATAAFFQKSGLKTGDKIATISHNHWHTVVHYFAAWICGMVPVPVNLGEDDQRISFILENAGVKMAMVREDYLDRISSVITEHKALKDIRIVECGDNEKVFMEKADDFEEQPHDPERDAFIVFTSGTTGNPKGVVLSQQNLLEDAANIAAWHEIDDQSRMMCVLPIHHVNGTVVTMITPFVAGASTVLNRKFSAGEFFETIREEQVHVVSTVPTLLQYLNSYYENKDKPESSPLRHVICGAGPLTVSVAEEFEVTFGIRIIHGYGLSESTCYSCFLPTDLSLNDHESWMRDYGYPSIGTPIPANEMQIHDEQGKPVEEEERGEIVIRGKNVMKGYFNNPEANEKAFTFGWFRSGDEGFYVNDRNGRPFFFITGRIKELIIRGGINLAPLEIDEVINKVPGVESAIAVGFENDWYGEEVGAYVKLKPGVDLSPEEIIHFCRRHLPFAKCPKVVVFGKDIPVTSTGKFQRRKVLHLFNQGKREKFRDR
jgi:long-chain acyl-CoA synthetase